MDLLTPPPFRLYLMRHANAAWPGPGQSDFDRPLDARGFAEAELVAERAADLGYRPDRVIVSTARRCRETAEPLKRVFDEDLDIRFSDSLYHGSASVYAEIISAQSDCQSVLLIGHNPSIEELFGDLAGAEAVAKYAGSGYPTAGLAVLDASASVWSIIRFITDMDH
ncbi:SixA phosphatase family protein [Rhizobium sp. PAMB 3182]